MKKTLKIVLVIFTIIAMLGGNTAVLAQNIANEITSEEKEASGTPSVPAEQQDNQTSGETVGTQGEKTKNEDGENSSEKGTTEETEKANSETTGETTEKDVQDATDEKTGTTQGQNTEDESEETENYGIMAINEPMPIDAGELDTSNLKGKLELSIDLRFPQKQMSAKDLTVTLKKKGEAQSEKVVTANGVEKEKQLFYTFNDLEPSTENSKYSLTIQGIGYQTFSQAGIEIKPNTTSELHLTNGYDGITVVDENGDSMLGDENQTTSQKRGRTGVVGLGDVNKDGKITNQDVSEIISKIEEGKNENYVYDLNKDGEIDIADISYAVLNEGHSFIGASARYITNIDVDNVEAKAEVGSIVRNEDGTTGTIQDLLRNNDKHITLQPEKPEEPIGIENPIKVEIDIKEDTAQTQMISIAPSSNEDNNITQGTIVVDGHNYETGEDVEITCVVGQVQNPETAEIKTLYKVAQKTTVISDVKVAEGPIYKPQEGGTATISNDGTIIVDFGSAIAVKRVIINVTGTTSNKLADISKVEFLNGMQDKIPEPDLNVPTLRVTDIDDSITEESFIIKWNNEQNVTGYHVAITANIEGKDITDEYDVDGHQITIEQFNGKAIKDLLDKGPKNEGFTTYYVKVRSVNGEWHSPYCDAYPVQPQPTSRPNPPTGVKLKGGYQQISVSWSGDPRASSYIVEYKPTNSSEDFKVATPVTTKYNELTKQDETIGIQETSYTIKGLPSGIEEYSVRVKGCNSRGVSEPSQIATASTLDVQEVELPTYKKINTSLGNGVLSNHIKNITFVKTSKNDMVDSQLDMENGEKVVGSAKGVADNSFSSYFRVDDWDYGGFYTGSDKGLKVEFDQIYTMNYITLAKVQWNGEFKNARVWYYDSTSKNPIMVSASQVAKKQDKDGHYYASIRLQKPITTDKIIVSFGHDESGSNRLITVAEMGFYEYDEIEGEINNLFKDGTHLELADDISTDEAKAKVEAKINDLEKRLNEGIDKVGGKPGEKDYHPEKGALLDELETAKLILANKNLGRVTKINSQIATAYDSNIEFRGSLNGYQPVGVAGRSGEEITIYVGNPYKNIGDPTNLELIATQWRAEGDFQRTVISNLQVGINKITIPEITSKSTEKGGSLYINYKGLREEDPYRFIDRNYAVRVSGGIEIPVLDLSSKEDPETGKTKAMTEAEKRAAVTEYVKELEKVVGSLEERHNGQECEKYKGANEDGIKDCLLGLTEIVLDPMMYSVSSKQIYDGLTEKLGQNATTEQRANALYDSLTAMEQMMELFYAQKGLVKQGATQDTNKYGNNTYPRTRQNIRCMRMQGRAFMYAGGLHIGIQWNEVKDLAKGVPMQVDGDGKVTNPEQGNYFGWGIAHEIGHVINQQAYVHGEVTNNYFSILAQTDNTRKTVRFSYDDVYKKVTSGKTGKAQNVFTQLGLYWQLHLAYDTDGYNYKQYPTQKAQLENSIYARMDTYARNPSKAPKPTNDAGITLTLDKESKDDNLMRLACAAAEKNILEFFIKWGMIPNEDTVKYAEQWNKEERAIWYVNDESRNYVVERNMPLYGYGDAIKLNANITNATSSRINDNKVNFSIEITGADVKGVLGYEIIRSYRSNDTEVSRPVAFVEPTVNEDGTVSATTTYIDTIDTINNRVFTYTIVAYDKYLYEIGRIELDPVKVSHKGQISQSGWEVTTNMTSNEDKDEAYSETSSLETSDFEQKVSAVPTIADGKEDTVFNGTVEQGKAEITITLPEMKRLVGLEYSGKKLGNYEIQVYDGKEWITVRKEENNLVESAYATVKNLFAKITNSEEVAVKDEVIKFAKVIDGEQTVYNYDYDCTQVKLIIDDTNVSISEIDLLGQSGDNVEFFDATSIGKNASSFVYDKEAGYSIPEGAIIFMGTYKGNPAYNVTKLWYQEEGSKEWKMLNGYQIIYAPDPGEADLGETEEGKWIWVLEKQEIGLDGKPTGKENEDYKRIEQALGKGKVRVELYRVDNALTNDGERLVSDTLIETIPTTLSNITINSDYNQ